MEGRECVSLGGVGHVELSEGFFGLTMMMINMMMMKMMVIMMMLVTLLKKIR